MAGMSGVYVCVYMFQGRVCSRSLAGPCTAGMSSVYVCVYMFQGRVCSRSLAGPCMAGMSGVYVCVYVSGACVFQECRRALHSWDERSLCIRLCVCFRGVCVPGVPARAVWLG